MSDQEKKFALSAEEETLLRAIRNQGAVEPTEAEQRLMLKLREKKLDMAAAKATESEPPATLEEIRPGMEPRRLSEVLKQIRALAG